MMVDFNFFICSRPNFPFSRTDGSFLKYKYFVENIQLYIEIVPTICKMSQPIYVIILIFGKNIKNYRIVVS